MKVDGVKIDGQGTIMVASGGALNNNGSCTVAIINAPYKRQNVVATARDTQVELKWDAPLSDGGSPITG